MRAVRPSRLLVRGVSLGGSVNPRGYVDVLLERGPAGKILAIGNRESWNVSQAGDTSTTHVMDAQGLVAMPGLFNAHACATSSHGRQTSTTADSATSHSDRSSRASTLAKTMAAMVAMLKTGTTSALFPAHAHPEAVIEAAVRVGMRATVAVTARDSAVRGNPATAAAVDVERVMSLAHRWRSHPTVTVALGLDATIAQCRPAYLDAIVGLCAKHELHVHARVDRRDAYTCARSITRLGRLTLCGTRLSIAVCDNANGADDADAHVPVYSCVPPFAHMADRRRVPWASAAAVGGFACPFERMRRLASADGTMGAHDAWRLAVRPGTRARAVDTLTDSLCVGDVADVVLVDPRWFTPSQHQPIPTTALVDDNNNTNNNNNDHINNTLDDIKQRSDPFSVNSIVRHCQSSDVACVIVAGRIVVALGAATLVDERAILR